jgi:predicted nucleotidyltransferase
MPFSVLLGIREEEKELHRRKVMEAVKHASTALRERFPYDELCAFGSLVSGGFDRHSDIDLMIKGLSPDDYFKAYAFLFHALPFRHELDLKRYEDCDGAMRKVTDMKGLRVG